MSHPALESTTASASGGQPLVPSALTLERVLQDGHVADQLWCRLARRQDWCALLKLPPEPEAVACWGQQQLSWLGSKRLIQQLRAIPHHPSTLWGLWLPLQLRLERQRRMNGGAALLGLAGVPGMGKTTLSRALLAFAAQRGLRTVVASIDDYYLPLQQRQAAMAGNPYGIDRGPPGSHDLVLLRRGLERYRQGGVLQLPRFDKTLEGGRGDRVCVAAMAGDLLLLEGWMVGARPFAVSSAHPWPGATAAERRWCERCGRALMDYRDCWQQLDGLVLVLPQRWRQALRWRLQAEARQRRGGGGAMDGAAIAALMQGFWGSLPPALAIRPLLDGRGAEACQVSLQGVPAAPHSAAALQPPVVMTALLDGRRRIVQVGSVAAALWPGDAP
ncbi:MAG: hypothetical protein ERJ69_04905 [Aphanocapsa feldmannii 288cV]|nr:MAG: hypothetical protein ERJ69_04905 [Aphanocapsa feldmannii 288cV]